MIAVIDYGVGNLFSLCSSLKFVGAEAVITDDREIIARADGLILPGVGAFGDAAEKLKSRGLDNIIKNEVSNGKKIMGICLGMQLLFEKSHEYGVHEGLGLLKGEIVPMDGKIPAELKIPHIGWNGLYLTKESSLLDGIRNGECVYFVHSYYAENCDESLAATAEYGKEITAAVEYGNVCGCQFHPEKSGKTGLKILENFVREVEKK